MDNKLSVVEVSPNFNYFFSSGQIITIMPFQFRLHFLILGLNQSLMASKNQSSIDEKVNRKTTYLNTKTFTGEWL